MVTTFLPLCPFHSCSPYESSAKKNILWIVIIMVVQQISWKWQLWLHFWSNIYCTTHERYQWCTRRIVVLVLAPDLILLQLECGPKDLTCYHHISSAPVWSSQFDLILFELCALHWKSILDIRKNQGIHDTLLYLWYCLGRATVFLETSLKRNSLNFHSLNFHSHWTLLSSSHETRMNHSMCTFNFTNHHCATMQWVVEEKSHKSSAGV